MDNIKEKIKKLLALSQDNPSDAEGYAAFQKAQELMARYKLDKSDISDEGRQQCISLKTSVKYGTRSSNHYVNDLAAIIAQNFCCVNYISTTKGTQSHYIWFMGMKEDVEISEEILHTAIAYIKKGYNRVYYDVCREYDMSYLPTKYWNPIKTGYIDGYLDGFKSALESQKAQNQEWGLVLVPPQEAKDYISSLNTFDFGRGGNSVYDYSYYNEGYEDGSHFSRNKRIGEVKKIK